VAAFAAGKLYFVDGAEINRIDERGTVTPWVGKNPRPPPSVYFFDCGAVEVGSGVGICSPQALALDGSGNIFFMDRYVRWDSGTNSKPSPFPAGGGQVLPADERYAYGARYPGLAQLRKVTPEGVVSGVLAHQYGLGGVAVDAAGNTYVGERFLKDYTSSCNSLFCGPDNGGGTVWKVSPNGSVSSIWTSSSVTPERVVVDNNGNLYVGANSVRLDTSIVKLSPDGSLLGQLVGDRFSMHIRGALRDFLVDAQGNLIIASNNRIRKISPAGVTTEFGLAGSQGAVDGPGDTARFSEISALAFDTAGNIFVADRDNHAIRKISPAGIVSTVVGKLGSSGIALGDLPGSLYQPNGLAFDKEGVLYISSGDAILKVKLP
jgi:hypothetical protein